MQDIDHFLNKYTRFMTKDIYINKTMYNNFLKSYNYLYDRLKKDALLYHQSIAFTGKLSMPKSVLEQQTKNVSALYSHSVNSQTDYLVVGKHGYNKERYGHENKKVNKALELIKKGQDLKIIHENEYMELLDMKK